MTARMKYKNRSKKSLVIIFSANIIVKNMINYAPELMFVLLFSLL